VRLVLDGTVVRVRLDRKATSISLLVVLGVRDDGHTGYVASPRPDSEVEGTGRRNVATAGDDPFGTSRSLRRTFLATDP
jgi:hypothetical protein